MKKDKNDIKRIHLTVSMDMYRNIEKLAYLYGLPVTSLATYYVGKMVYAEGQANNILTAEVMKDVINAVSKEIPKKR